MSVQAATTKEAAAKKKADAEQLKALADANEAVADEYDEQHKQTLARMQKIGAQLKGLDEQEQALESLIARLQWEDQAWSQQRERAPYR